MGNLVFVSPLTLPMEIIELNLSNKDLPVETLAQEGLAMPMGIMYLSSYIKRHNSIDNIGLIDYRINSGRISEFSNLQNFIREIAQKSIDFTPDIIAFSVIVSTSHKFFIKCLDILKSIWPNAVVIAGGFHPTNFTKELLENNNIDYVFRGEGEVALSEFIDAYFNKEDINIHGVYSRPDIGNGHLELCKYITQLDEISLPDYDLINMEKYTTGNTRQVIKKTEKGIVRSANLMTTRGCPFKCTFCSSHTVHSRTVRYRSIESVIKEVRYLHEKYGVTLFMPEDDLFTSNKKRTLNLLKSLEDLNIPNFTMQFPVALSVNTLDDEVLSALISSGMNVASLAIESGSEFVQKKIIKKNVNLNKAKRIVKFLHERKIPVRCSFVMGFPRETKEHLRETIEYAKELCADWNDFFIATPLPGSEMCNEFLELGYIPNDIELLSLGYYSKRVFDTSEIAADELIELVYRANLECNFVHNINMVEKRWEEAIKVFEPIVTKYPFHIVGWHCIMICKKALAIDDEILGINNKIKDLIKTDPRAAQMYQKYSDLLPEVNFN